MDKKLEQELEKHGWIVECESPLELRHTETASFASNWAAVAVLEQFKCVAREDYMVQSTACVVDVPTNEFTIAITADKIRNLGTKLLRTTDVSSAHAEAFLLLYGSALQDRLNQTIKDFVTEKLV